VFVVSTKQARFRSRFGGDRGSPFSVVWGRFPNLCPSQTSVAAPKARR